MADYDWAAAENELPDQARALDEEHVWHHVLTRQPGWIQGEVAPCWYCGNQVVHIDQWGNHRCPLCPPKAWWPAREEC